MTVSGVGSVSSGMLQSILDMRSQLDDLQRQLGTGEKSDTYSGLGLDSGLTVSLNAQLAALNSYGSTINMVTTRIGVASTALQQMSSYAGDVKSATLSTPFDPDDTGQTTTQKIALADLGSFLGLLNTQVANRYIFSGQATDQPAVDTMDHILNGNGPQAGLKQVIQERNEADLGADGLGRLAIGAPTTSSVTLAETPDGTASPFGLKLAGVTSNLTGATVTGPTGSPPAISVDFSGTPADGQTIKYTFTLPDGTSDSVTLEAVSGTPTSPNQFVIGATPDQTAANMKASLSAALTTFGQTTLSAASAVAASDNFFDNPPQRVNGAPPSASTALVDGTAADTVIWYTGGDTAGSARSTATAKIDQSITVSYGTQANEQGIRQALQGIATAAAVTYSAADPNAAARNQALSTRLNTALSAPPGTQSIQGIETDLANAQSAMKAASTRQQQTTNTLTDLLQKVSTVPPEQVGAQILALQTSLQASLQTTAMLSQISLINYLPA
ncbi:MAG TPA: flagellar biosynthesis protein FlgL [Pseudolabrys sp.]|nr:flagellar biosynthesis protein FlgL [Pseudolabrys sp.]